MYIIQFVMLQDWNVHCFVTLFFAFFTFFFTFMGSLIFYQATLIKFGICLCTLQQHPIVFIFNLYNERYFWNIYNLIRKNLNVQMELILACSVSILYIFIYTRIMTIGSSILVCSNT